MFGLRSAGRLWLPQLFDHWHFLTYFGCEHVA
jgi:hypothetical protein